MKHQRAISAILIIVGLALFVLGSYWNQFPHPFATVVTDSSPPVWELRSDGLPSLSPYGGVTYTSINMIQAGVADPESGVASVVATIDSTAYPLSTQGDKYGGAVWTTFILPALSTEGSHTITYVATNGVGLQLTYSGTFNIFRGLQGTWTINDVIVTDSSATLYFNTTQLTFKFVKTLGAASDTSINCFVTENGATIATLAYQGSSTWTGTASFSGGKHVLSLKASDGTNTVTMAMLSVDFGGITLTNVQIGFYGTGAGCVGLGSYGLLRKKRT